MVVIREGGKIKMRLFTIDAICMQMKILFSFPPFIGHLNPSLPIAKALVERGHEVHFISTTEVKEKIINATKIDTSNFYCSRSIHEEFYKGISLDNTSPLAPMESIFAEFNLPKTEFVSQLMCLNIELERKLHDTIKLMRALHPDIVIYDALIRGRDAMYAARILGIKSVGQFSLAGAGSWPNHGPASMHPLTLKDASKSMEEFGPNVASVKRLNSQYPCLQLIPGLPEVEGKLDTFASNTILVPTSEDLQDPMIDELAEAYEKDGVRFVFTGPLLLPEAVKKEGELTNDSSNVLEEAKKAKESGRPIILASMGTLIVSNHELNGWNGRSGGANRSLSGREMCQSAWGAVLDEYGSDAACTEEKLPLIIMSIGHQRNALGNDIAVPSNAICLPSIPQLDLLRIGVDLFLTHGGQNSFTEAMATATPVVVCPGFGDQVVNSRKAVTLGVGLGVDRPHANVGDENLVAEKYRKNVAAALRQVYANRAQYQAAAEKCKARLDSCGGVAHAVDALLNV